MRPHPLLSLCVLLAASAGGAGAEERLVLDEPWRGGLAAGAGLRLDLPALEAGATYALDASLLAGDLAPGEAVAAELRLSGAPPLGKTLHAGDPSLYLPFRPRAAGEARLDLRRGGPGRERPIPAAVRLVRLGGPGDAARFEAEPNDGPREANPLAIGRAVEGSADDVEYLDHEDEGKRGLDWFRFEVEGEEPCLVIFELDLLDRDVAANLRVHAPVPGQDGAVEPYLEGKDPMEIVHDRERERYSKAITRVFKRGVYLLEVNANHPRYRLLSRRYPVPPYADPRLAVEVGLRYIMDVGDAWFAQVPRAGDIYRRAQNLHETSLRCTACHPSVFSTEANLTAHRNGYPIPSKSNFSYVIERLYNSITPFYGPDGLWWQRFIAIPLQSQGKQGGILLDFERQITGRATGIPERFGPLVRAAWIERERLPEDEQNGVVPLDSPFGFAWRDWKLLRELHRRTGEASYAAAADRIRAIITAPAAEKAARNLQDRMHLLLALAYMGRGEFGARIAAEAERLLGLQGADGGWHEEGKPGAASAEYATGQMVYTLLEAGFPASDPRLGRALRWLLSRQQRFGGWFQTDTHENFRTPMRETRYAVMALASAYPRGGALQGLGNQDGGPARAPRMAASPGDLLDDLENLHDASADARGEVARAIEGLLGRPEPPLRAAAAAALGRIASGESAGALAPLLADPSKPVWRAAAWALRRIANHAFPPEGLQGLGGGAAAGALREALSGPDPLARRGAARAFAYQFHGMDGRLELARLFPPLASDPDLLTRLQAIRTLRQWWYRTEDPGVRHLAVRTILERMAAEEEPPVQRRNLRENLYILLDENHSGGVSIQRNLRDLPPAVGKRVLDGRAQAEREFLLDPVLEALAGGTRLQRQALLEGFDGSFFKGRTYAKNPRAMIDVGNDREFGFLYEPGQPLLERTLGRLIETEPDPALRKRGWELASFFHMPRLSASETLQRALLGAVAGEEGALRATARTIARRDLVLLPAEAVAGDAARILADGDAEARAALIAALGRSPEALGAEPVRREIEAILDREAQGRRGSADLLPLASTAALDDTRALRVLSISWKALEERPAAERLPVLEALGKRAALLAQAEPPREAVRLLEKAATDPQVAVREKLFELLSGLEAFRQGTAAAGILYAGLSDESPAIRARSLALARANGAVWREEDVHEYVLKLLVDADAKIRRLALDCVAERGLLAAEPRYGPRVKALLDGDAGLRGRALEVLGRANLDPQSLRADAQVAGARLPDLLLFRDRVNAYFYRKAEDGNACASCHATHTILGLAEPPADGRPLTDAEVIANYRSVLKVINTADPEQSLVLRKPRSPFGTGQSSGDSPTGLTHVGGTRWRDGAAGEAYQAILAFIRSARSAGEPVRRDASADSYSPEYPPALAADGDPETLWHTEFVGAAPGHPHELVLDLHAAREVVGLNYLPRADSSNGRVRDFEVYLSEDGKEWGRPLARGSWPDDPLPKIALVAPTRARYVKLRGLSEVRGQPYMSAAEVDVILGPPKQPAAPRRARL